MRRLARMVAIVLSLALVAGAVLHAAQATSMAMEMSVAAHSDGTMPGCDGCPGGADGGMACAKACVTPAAAVLPTGLPVVGTPVKTFEAAHVQALVGHLRPPDPYPPRTTVLG
jgi:uncharacterized membrane protein